MAWHVDTDRPLQVDRQLKTESFMSCNPLDKHLSVCVCLYRCLSVSVCLCQINSSTVFTYLLYLSTVDATKSLLFADFMQRSLAQHGAVITYLPCRR